MGSTVVIIAFGLLMGLFGFMVLVRPSGKRFTPKKLVPGQKMTNRKGKHYTVGRHGKLIVDPEKLIRSPEFQKQLNGFHSLYMQETILALWQGKRPPNSVGGYGVLTKKKLIIEWNDEWQAVMDNLEESFDINYNILFDITDEHPPVTILLTADEIAEQYGSEKES